MLLRRVQMAESTPSIRTASRLADASLTIYQKALKEQLPLAHIAEQCGRPQYWFANNVLQVVGIYGRVPAEHDFVHLTRETAGGMRLSDEMTALMPPNETEPRYVDLRITKVDFEKYLEWARTVY